jgi:hypothetical protein
MLEVLGKSPHICLALCSAENVCPCGPIVLQVMLDVVREFGSWIYTPWLRWRRICDRPRSRWARYNWLSIGRRARQTRCSSRRRDFPSRRRVGFDIVNGYVFNLEQHLWKQLHALGRSEKLPTKDFNLCDVFEA